MQSTPPFDRTAAQHLINDDTPKKSRLPTTKRQKKLSIAQQRPKSGRHNMTGYTPDDAPGVNSFNKMN